MNLFYDIKNYSPTLPEGHGIITIPTDSKKVNALLGGGISTSEFVLIQAAAGKGKTTILERLALKSCVYKQYTGEVAFISLGEQSAQVIWEQILCMNSNIDYKSEYHKLPNEKREAIYEEMKKNQKPLEDKLKIYYTRQPFNNYYYNKKLNDIKESLFEIPEEFRMDWKETNDFNRIMEDIIERQIKFVFVDYVGAESADPNITSRYESLKTFCDTLAYTAEKENICIVGGIQTNKNFLAYYESDNFRPENVNELYTADSVNTIRKATIGISFIRNGKTEKDRNYSYLNIFKGRYVDTGCVPIKIHTKTYRWYDIEEDMGWTD